jgi:protein ImuB
MAKRYVTIWFQHLITDWFTRQLPGLKNKSFVLVSPDHGRMIIRNACINAQGKGIYPGMVLADARAIFPSIEVFDDKPDLAEKILKKICVWCIRYTPETSIDLPDGLILDVSGCAHLWGGEEAYLKDISTRLNNFGYHVRIAIADTIGVAWAVTRFGKHACIVKPGEQLSALMPLPPASLRLDINILERMQKLGLYQVSSFIAMPRSVLRRRFGETILQRIDQALGKDDETIQSLIPVEAYSERLPCFDPIITKAGIEIAIKKLLEKICHRLQKESKGLRVAVLKCFCVDGKIGEVRIATNHPSNHADHLFKLFELKIPLIEPGLGIELFILEAPKIENIDPIQETLWRDNGVLEDSKLAELLDKFESKFGNNTVHRYLPAEHYWPERSFKKALSLQEKATTVWTYKLRPIIVLPEPEPIQVTAPIPDYPPMLFRYKDKLHKVKKADGPERIEREWWLETGLTRDYYCVEDQEGQRYWLFRSGHYDGEQLPSWFIHGFFA